MLTVSADVGREPRSSRCCQVSLQQRRFSSVTRRHCAL